jgi:hypothetical protein
VREVVPSGKNPGDYVARVAVHESGRSTCSTVPALYDAFLYQTSTRCVKLRAYPITSTAKVAHLAYKYTTNWVHIAYK